MGKTDSENIVTAICQCGRMVFDKRYYDPNGNAATKFLKHCIHNKKQK